MESKHSNKQIDTKAERIRNSGITRRPLSERARRELGRINVSKESHDRIPLGRRGSLETPYVQPAPARVYSNGEVKWFPKTAEARRRRRKRLVPIALATAALGAAVAIGPSGSAEAPSSNPHIVKMTDRLAERANFDEEDGHWTWTVRQSTSSQTEGLTAVTEELLGDDWDVQKHDRLVEAIQDFRRRQAVASGQEFDPNLQPNEQFVLPSLPDLYKMPSPDRFDRWVENHS